MATAFTPVTHLSTREELEGVAGSRGDDSSSEFTEGVDISRSPESVGADASSEVTGAAGSKEVKGTAGSTEVKGAAGSTEVKGAAGSSEVKGDAGSVGTWVTSSPCSVLEEETAAGSGASSCIATSEVVSSVPGVEAGKLSVVTVP